MNFDLFQNISNVLILIGILLTGIGGFGSYYFGKKNDTKKEIQVQKKESELNNKISILISGNDELKSQLEPFQKIAKFYFPNDDTSNALTKLSTEIESLKLKANEIDKRTQNRSISEKQQQILLNKLKKLDKNTIIIKSMLNDNESYQYALEFADVFKRAGWKVSGPSLSQYDDQLYGLFISITTDIANERINKLYNCMSDAGFDIQGLKDKSQNPNDFILVIGSKNDKK